MPNCLLHRTEVLILNLQLPDSNMETCNTVLTIGLGSEIPWCGHSNETSSNQQYFCMLPFVFQHCTKGNLGFFS